MGSFNLPEVALIRVLNHLQVRDQMNTRLVCRYWKLITDNFARRNELILFLQTYPSPVYWFYNRSEADLGNAFLLTTRAFLKSEFFLSYFRRVRRLMIVHKKSTKFKKFVELLQTSFPELRHLQFSTLDPKFSGIMTILFRTNLQLANLRTFYSQTGDMPLGLHCPQLSELYVYSHLKINQATDEQTRQCIQNLRFLSVKKLTYPSGFEFSNLEIFYFNEPSPAIALSDFPRLKELHYFDAFLRVHEELEDCLRSLLAQKRRLNRNQLRIFFDGFELTDIDSDFNNFNYLEPGWNLCGMDLNEKVVRFIKENPLGLKFNLLSKSLLMSDALSDVLVDLPEDDELMESMFRSAKCIEFERPLDMKSLNLFELSNRFRYVSTINIHVELSQTQLDRLSDALPYLVCFVYWQEFFKNHILNFEFIAKFKSLHSFIIHHSLLSIDELRLILENCKFIDGFSFRKSNAKIEMLRNFEQGLFEVEWLSSNNAEFAAAMFGTEELLDYLETSRWIGKNDFLGEGRDEEPPLNLRLPSDEEEYDEEDED